MLRLKFYFLIVALSLLCVARPAQTISPLKRLTNTPEEALNLNPSLSDDGKTVVFESSSDVFHAFRIDVLTGWPDEIGATRMVSPALSGDGRMVAFASTEDLTGQNADRNSEIFLFDGLQVKQLTHTQPRSIETRLIDGNFQPSMTSDGRVIVYSSGGEIFLMSGEKLAQGESPKITGDGSRVFFKNPDLWMIDMRTRVTTLVTSDIEDFAVSDDGRRVVYSARVAPNQTQLFLFDGGGVRQLTLLGARVTDVKLQPAISGDGKRVAFATRRRVTNSSDGSVELYVIDLPTGQVQQVTNAPSAATAEVTSSMNFDGTLIAFNFPRVLSGPASEDFANNSEIYLASLVPRPSFNAGTILDSTQIAPSSIVHFRGSSLAFRTDTSTEAINPPLSLAGTTVNVNGQPARMFYTSPDEVVFVVPEGVATGPGEVVVTNADGFPSKAEVMIATVAPQVFTTNGQGVVLDSDTLQPAPFDPANGKRRLSIFATGLRHASSLSVTISGQLTIFETVAPGNLAGLDEIHVLLPSTLSGAGTAALVVDADGVRSNPASIAIAGLRVDKVVISQIFGGGGNAGSPFRNDFIEIFNAGDTPVNLAGWSIQYASATASTWSATPLSSIVLSPGQYYLVQQAGGSNGSPLPAPDATGAIAMAAGSGKVALVKNTTALTGACPSSPNIVDLAGYGSTANCFRGAAPAPAASNTNAATRKTNGCTDTSNNAGDFALAPPNPKNTSTPINRCSLVIVQSVLQSSCGGGSETLRLAHALAQRRNHDFAPALRLRRFP
jgi:uncharacterized protein (TIGR03437 family)